jgi:hypothetical protein
MILPSDMGIRLLQTDKAEKSEGGALQKIVSKSAAVQKADRNASIFSSLR